MTKRKTNFVEITCHPDMLKELGNNNCSLITLLCELVDNTAAELEDCKTAHVDIIVGGSWEKNGDHHGNKYLDLSTAYLQVSDNATGILRSQISHALSLATKNKNGMGSGLHEHGLGMKTAIASLGTLEHIISKTKTDPVAFRINEFKIGKVEVFDEPAFSETGTLIRIKNLKPIVYKRKIDYTNFIVSNLGARYRYLLKGTIGGKKLTITLKLVDQKGQPLKDAEGRDSIWDIQPVEPIYQNNTPKVINKELKGAGGKWAACLSFGFAPSKEELNQNDLKFATGHPYNSWARLIDVVMHDRVLCRYTPQQIGGCKSAKAVFAPWTGELILRYGFKTSFTKDGILENDNWIELQEKIGKIIDPIIQKKIHQENQVEKDEKFYKDKIYNQQTKAFGKTFHREYVVEGTEGFIDLVVDNESWEVKAIQATGADVYQLLWYIDFGKDVLKDKGTLVAPSFSPGCIYTAEQLKIKRGIDIKLITLADLGLQ